MSVTIYEWRPWRFEPEECRLTRDGTLVPLPAKTMDLLELLVARAPNLVTKGEILANVWADATVEEGNIAFHVAALRKALDRDDDRSCIETVRGRGYRFVVPVASRPQENLIPSAADVTTTAAPATAPRRHTRWRAILAIGTLVAVVALVAFLRQRPAEWSVVVLPFELVESGDADFGPGLSQYMVMHLELAGIRVRRHAGGPMGEPHLDAAARVGADSVLTGTLQRSSTGWRVSVQTVRVSDGHRDWNWAFDVADDEERPSEDLEDDARSRLQVVIAKRIAAGLTRRLAGKSARIPD